jgi:DNA-binding response OmpR family regulator
MNQVMALEMGGDDFVAKPFDLAVLLAKTQALLRRTYDFKTVSTLLSYQDVVLDIAKGQLIFDQQAIELTKNEIKIMEMLMNNPTTIVTRQQLMAKLWASDEYIDDNTLTVNINRLRKKLQLAGLPDFIQTKKGLGYSLGSPC